MKHIKLFESFTDDFGNSLIDNPAGEGDVRVLNNMNMELFNSLPDERNNVSAGDWVIVLYYIGEMSVVEFELIQQDPGDTEPLGNSDDGVFYGLETAYHVVKKVTYKRALLDLIRGNMNQ
jgi:hypothetical protein